MNGYSRLCAGIIRALVVQFRTNAADREPTNRLDMVGAIEDALARRARRRALRTQLTQLGLLAAAALVLIAGWTVSRRAPGLSSASSDLGSRARVGRTLTVLGNSDFDAGRSIEGAVVVVGGGGTSRQALARGMALHPGTALFAAATSEIQIGTVDGTTVTLEKGSQLTVVEQGAMRRFSLRTGAVRAQVAKLPTGERFVITTDDAEVEVHGTVFRVAMVPTDPACGKGVRTRVLVFEGVVGVRVAGVEAYVPAGAEWPEGCIGVPGTFGAVRPTGRGHGVRRSVSLASGPIESDGSPSASATSFLTIQNDLFASAIRAKQQRRSWDSVRLFSRLIDTYPEGPLTEGAMAQRMNLLGTVDPVAASRAASGYLARFPGGFARGEARRLLDLAP